MKESGRRHENKMQRELVLKWKLVVIFFRENTMNRLLLFVLIKSMFPFCPYLLNSQLR